MTITQEKIDGLLSRVKVNLKKEDYEPNVKKQIKTLAKQVQIKGFRPGMVPLDVLLFGNLGIALTAASAAAVNHLVDRRIDKVMARTHNRPVAQGRIDTRHAIAFAAVLGIAGMAVLILLVNQLTAWLTLASHVGYAVILRDITENRRATDETIQSERLTALTLLAAGLMIAASGLSSDGRALVPAGAAAIIRSSALPALVPLVALLPAEIIACKWSPLGRALSFFSAAAMPRRA